MTMTVLTDPDDLFDDDSDWTRPFRVPAKAEIMYRFEKTRPQVSTGHQENGDAVGNINGFFLTYA